MILLLLRLVCFALSCFCMVKNYLSLALPPWKPQHMSCVLGLARTLGSLLSPREAAKPQHIFFPCSKTASLKPWLWFDAGIKTKFKFCIFHRPSQTQYPNQMTVDEGECPWWIQDVNAISSTGWWGSLKNYTPHEKQKKGWKEGFSLASYPACNSGLFLTRSCISHEKCDWIICFRVLADLCSHKSWR